METPQVNRKQIDDLRAWFFAKDRSISLAQSCLYYLFSGGQANGAYMSMAFIAETVLSASAASVTLSNIPQDFRHLILITQARTDAAAETDNINLRFNNDSGSNYDFNQVFGNSATPGASVARATTSLSIGAADGANSRAANFNAGITFIIGYSLNDRDKRAMTLTANYGDASADGDLTILFRGGRWRNKNVITSINLLPATGPNLVSDSRFQLYGIL